MVLIKKLLEVPIGRGYMKWEKVEEKISAGIVFLNLPDAFYHPSAGVKFEDSVLLECIAPNPKGQAIKWAYKIIRPRLLKGKLWCSGFMLGQFPTLKAIDPFWFPNTLKEF